MQNSKKYYGNNKELIDTIRQLGNMTDDNIDNIVNETLKAIDLLKNKKERDYELTMRYRI